MKKLKEDEFENNFQFEIIHWNKRIAIKIRWDKSLEKINERAVMICCKGDISIKVERGKIKSK